MPRCPVCFVPMTRIEEEGMRAHTCPSCFGHWVPTAGLLRRLRHDVEMAMPRMPPVIAPPVQGGGDATPPPLPESAPIPAEPVADAGEVAPTPSAPPSQETSLEDLAAVVVEADSKKPVRCPQCEKFMTKERYQQMIPVNVDRCKQCNQIWLDTGEYNLIRRLFVELSLSADPQVVHLRDKVAMVTAAFEHRQTLTPEASRAMNRGASFTDLTLDALTSILRS